uniref:Uncharacterized protein n=1 Tax=Cyriopagopus schmidti TaxID=29017 RepID=B5M6D1_CYRSC|nr:unknown [Cyriopagopus schmidti]
MMITGCRTKFSRSVRCHREKTLESTALKGKRFIQHEEFKKLPRTGSNTCQHLSTWKVYTNLLSPRMPV